MQLQRQRFASPGRPKTKAPATLMRFKPSLDKFLREQSEKEGKTMAGFIEGLLEYRAQFKVWPPAGN